MRNSASEEISENLITFNWSENRILIADHQGKPVEEEFQGLKLGKFHFWVGH